MQTFGELSFSIGGRRRILRADCEFENLAGLETQVEGNLDGSVFQTAKTSPVMLKVTLEEEADGEFTADELVRSQDVTLTEEHRGVSRLMSNAKISGHPSYNPSTGAVTGMTWACARSDYRRL